MKRVLVTLLLALFPALASAQAIVVPSPVPSCANNDVLKWNTATSLFVCASAAATSQPLSDVSGLIANSADPTKILAFAVSGITTATTRTWTIPDANITVPTTIASLAANTFTGLQTLNGGFSGTTGVLSSTLSVAGVTTFNTVAYTWPGSQGAADTFLKNNGSGTLSWGTQSAALPSPVTQDLLFTDATYDVGKAGATRPRDGFFSRNVVVGGTFGVTGASTITSLSATSGTFSTTLSVTGASTLAAISATSGSFSSIVTATGAITSSAGIAGTTGTFSSTISSATSVALTGTTNNLGTITSGVWNAGAVTSSGLLAVNGFGTHTFSAGGTGSNTLQVTNSTSGTGNYATLGLDAGTTASFLRSYSQGYTTSGWQVQSGTSLYTGGAGGLSIVAEHASGALRFFSGGTLRGGWTSGGVFYAGTAFPAGAAGDIAVSRTTTTGIVFMGSDGNVYMYRDGANSVRFQSVSAMRWTGYGVGTITSDASGNLTAVSDERLKDRIEDLGYGLAEILQLRPVKHGYNELSGLERDHLYGGFLAQDVQRVMPLAVGMDQRGYLTLSDRPILGAVVTSIQQHNATIQQLAARIAALEGRR